MVLTFVDKYTCGWFCVLSFQNSGCMKLLRTRRYLRLGSFRHPYDSAGSWFPSTFNSRKRLERKRSIKCCESFARWLLGASRHENGVSVSAPPESAKCLNEFDYRREGLRVPTTSERHYQSTCLHRMTKYHS